MLKAGNSHMKKRLTVILGITTVSVLATVGIFAGIAAQSGDDSPKRSFAERVASILGLETEDVEDAFTQAKVQMRDERADTLFENLVEKGTLTQEEADAIVAWKDTKPDIEFNFTKMTRADKSGWGGRDFGKAHGSQVLSGEKLEYLVEEGILTQADADSLTDWYDQRPDAITKLMPGDDDRGRWGKHGRRWHGNKDRRGHERGNWVDKDVDA